MLNKILTAYGMMQNLSTGLNHPVERDHITEQTVSNLLKRADQELVTLEDRFGQFKQECIARPEGNKLIHKNS